MIAKQFIRSVISVGANINEAIHGNSRADFLSTLHILPKEASEMGYWLKLLQKTKLIGEQSYKALSSKYASLRIMLITAYRTAKEKKTNYNFSFLQNTSYEPLDIPLSQTEIDAFEQLNGILLPDEYKQFLLTIGNGIKIDVGKRDYRYIYGIKRPVKTRFNRRLKMEFVFDEPYHEHLDTHDFQLPPDCIGLESKKEKSCTKCPHLDDCFYAYSDELDEYDHMIYNGVYPISYAGCTYMYFLIVTGNHRGEVWINNETSDFAPSKKSFCEFLKWVSTTDVY